MLYQASHRVGTCRVICWGLWETVQYTLYGMIKGEELGIYTGMPVSLCLRAAPGSSHSWQLGGRSWGILPLLHPECLMVSLFDSQEPDSEMALIAPGLRVLIASPSLNQGWPFLAEVTMCDL